MSGAITADLAYERYLAAFEEGRLVQGKWQDDATDGRHLACALGSIDSAIHSPSDCPAHVMPRWLAKMTVWFFDRQSLDDARTWGLAFFEQLKRLDGKVPFEVVYDWHADFVCPLAIEVTELRKRDPEPHRKLQALHQRALTGDRAPREEWRASLADAYAYAYAYADAYADAYAYAYAYAYADADAYAYAYADAYADADAYAYAYADAYAATRRARVKRLADGMVECLRRVVAP